MDSRAIYFSESFCTVSVRFVQRWNKHLQNCNFLCLVYQWNEIKIQRERGVQCSSNINSIFDSRDKFVIRSLGLENQNQENHLKMSVLNLNLLGSQEENELMQLHFISNDRDVIDKKLHFPEMKVILRSKTELEAMSPILGSLFLELFDSFRTYISQLYHFDWF